MALCTGISALKFGGGWSRWWGGVLRVLGKYDFDIDFDIVFDKYMVEIMEVSSLWIANRYFELCAVENGQMFQKEWIEAFLFFKKYEICVCISNKNTDKKYIAKEV